MKTTITLIALSLLLTGCKTTQTPSTQNQTTPQTQEEVVSEFTKVSKAMAEGKPVTCSMTKTDGSSSMQYLIKQKKMKVTGVEAAGKTQNGALISDGEYFYSWDTKTKQGFKMKLPNPDDAQSFAKEKGQNIPSLQTEDDKKKYEDQGYTVDCAITLGVTDAEFIPPTDIKFSDFSSMMEDAQKMMKQMPSNMTPQKIGE